MSINGIKPISFGYSHKLKTLYKNDKLPSVIYGFYGDLLTKDTVTLEHLKPKSKGGQNTLANYVLASARNNQRRANFDIREFFDPEKASTYFDQFIKVKTKNFNGEDYVRKVLHTLSKLGIDPSFYKNLV